MIQNRARFGKIVRADHKGDTTIATFEPGVQNAAIEVAQDELTDFLNDCIDHHGSTPPVFARRIGEPDFTPFTPSVDKIIDVETILLQDPLVGG